MTTVDYKTEHRKLLSIWSDAEYRAQLLSVIQGNLHPDAAQSLYYQIEQNRIRGGLLALRTVNEGVCREVPCDGAYDGTPGTFDFDLTQPHTCPLCGFHYEPAVVS